ncbi:uncharacterized protein NMK_2287 [Novimethylophilus kurashikiensis]|uniref:Uncharacterized protein n=1 Tax=Novimethylophilus kurashikiensis TaxID=1825523 RepID=A0A2R5F916_9PROT|nr:hypothetical protein [Novimethylophilus kurashikiensis]GBG14687.1 uncharacterized protein NMK_2287 [Novimethylophilus kurashikiensis]
MQRPAQPVLTASVPSWISSQRSDGTIRISRNFSLAFMISVLLHALLLFVVVREKLLNEEVKPALPSTIVVNLAHKPTKTPEPETTPAPPPVEPPPPPQPVKKAIPPKTVKIPRPMTTPKPSPITIPSKPELQTPPPVAAAPQPSPPAKTLDPSQFPDMASYVKAMRDQRHAPSQDDTTEEVKQVKAPQAGTNGIFQVPRMDQHSAILVFRGWKGEYSYSRKETYQVDAKLGEDIHRAVIQKMIEIIRRYYDGDFNWMSPTRGEVVLSARLEDNDRLEKFLMNDFYGPAGLQF